MILVCHATYVARPMRAIKPKPPGAALCPSVLRVGGGQQLGRRAPTGLVLEIEITERLPVGVLHDEARVVMLIDDPTRREAAGASF